MGISNGLIIFLCILVGSIVVAAGAAIYRVTAREEFTAELPSISNDQANYMRKVRSRKWPMLIVEERMPESSINTSAV